MPRRYFTWGLFLALGSVLFFGCRTGPSNHSSASSPATPSGSTAQAEQAQELSDQEAQAHAHYAAGVIHDLNEEPDAALEDYYQAASQDVGAEDLVLEVTRRLLQRQQPEKAVELLVRASALPKASGAIWARLALAYSQVGKPEQAIVAARAAIKRSPNSLAGYQNLVQACLQTKQPDVAISALNTGAEQAGAKADFLIGLAEMYQNLSVQVPARRAALAAQALTLLTRAEELAPKEPLLRLRLADAFNQLGESAKAGEIFLQLLRDVSENPFLRERVHAKLADIYLSQSDHKRAIEQLQALVHDDPTNPLAHYYLGYLAFNEHKYSEAVDYFRKTLVLNPGFEQAYFDMALAYVNLNQATQALATLSQARGKFAQTYVLEFCTGLAYTRQKDYTNALRHYTAAEVIARATEPKRLDQDLYFQLGASSERTGDFEQAVKYFEKCLQLAPDFVEAMNYLGYMWAERGTNLVRARELIEKAVKAQPENAAYLDSLGWVFFKLNQPKEALTYILKAVELSKEPDPTLLDHLGDIYGALGERDKARQAWSKSLTLEPNPEIQKKLGKEAGP